MPFRFLQKPVSSDELSHVMMDSIEHISRAGQIFFFQIGHEKYQLHYHEIIYFEGAARKVMIHTSKSTYEIYGKIADIIVHLDKTLFCQTHASYIVNMNLSVLKIQHKKLSCGKTDYLFQPKKKLLFMDWD